MEGRPCCTPISDPRIEGQLAGRGQFAKCGVYLLGRRFELSGEFIGHRGSAFVRERAVQGDAQVFNAHLGDCCFLDW